MRLAPVVLLDTFDRHQDFDRLLLVRYLRQRPRARPDAIARIEAHLHAGPRSAGQPAALQRLPTKR